MAKTVYAQQHDNLDAICYRIFGSTAGLVEQVLELNPHLASLPLLPIGTQVIVPAPAEIQMTTGSTIQLWD